MSALLFGHDRAVADWVSGQVNKGKPFHEPFHAFGLLREGRLVGGFVFTGHNGTSVEMSLAGRATITRGAISALLDYVFRQLGYSRLQVHTKRRHKRVCRILHNGGLKYEGIARRFYGKDDAVVYALTVDDLPEFKSRWRLT